MENGGFLGQKVVRNWLRGNRAARLKKPSARAHGLPGASCLDGLFVVLVGDGVSFISMLELFFKEKSFLRSPQTRELWPI